MPLDRINAWVHGRVQSAGSKEENKGLKQSHDIAQMFAPAAALAMAPATAPNPRRSTEVTVIPASVEEERWDEERLRMEIRRIVRSRKIRLHDIMRAWDQSGDNKLCKAEFMENMESFISDHDIWEHHAAQIAAETFAKIDKGGNGTIDMTELTKWFEGPKLTVNFVRRRKVRHSGKGADSRKQERNAVPARARDRADLKSLKPPLYYRDRFYAHSQRHLFQRMEARTRRSYESRHPSWLEEALRRREAPAVGSCPQPEVEDSVELQLMTLPATPPSHTCMLLAPAARIAPTPPLSKERLRSHTSPKAKFWRTAPSPQSTLAPPSPQSPHIASAVSVHRMAPVSPFAKEETSPEWIGKLRTGRAIEFATGLLNYWEWELAVERRKHAHRIAPCLK